MGGEGGTLKSEENSFLKCSFTKLASCHLGVKCLKPSLPLASTFMGSLDVPITGDLFPAVLLTHLDRFLVSPSAAPENTPFTPSFMLLRFSPSFSVALLGRTQAEPTLALLTPGQSLVSETLTHLLSQQTLGGSTVPEAVLPCRSHGSFHLFSCDSDISCPCLPVLRVP